MTSDIQTGEGVEWDWGDGVAEGVVTKRFSQDVSRTISGTEVKRTASVDQPAFLIEQANGQEVLKSCTEVRRTGKA